MGRLVRGLIASYFHELRHVPFDDCDEHYNNPQECEGSGEELGDPLEDGFEDILEGRTPG